MEGKKEDMTTYSSFVNELLSIEPNFLSEVLEEPTRKMKKEGGVEGREGGEREGGERVRREGGRGESEERGREGR